MCGIVARSNGSHRETSLPARLRAALSDHAGAPDVALPARRQHDSNSKTVFWVIADVTAGRSTYGRGNPCDSQEQLYEFA